MGRVNKRSFVPSKPGTTSVEKWIWYRGKGLFAYYQGGQRMKSEWTLKELLRAGHNQGDGLPALETTEYFKGD